MQIIKTINIGLIGLGTVGKSFLTLLHKQEKALAKKNLNIKITMIALSDSLYLSTNKGINSFDLLLAAENREEARKLKNQEAIELNIEDFKVIKEEKEANILKVIEGTQIDLIIDVSPTNLENISPSFEYTECALLNNKHVITANKGPVALRTNELLSITSKKESQFKMEATVLSGTPVFNLYEQCLRADKVKRLRGILNGTTNFMLQEMRKEKSYQEALQEAQTLGYAETDPRNDVEGWDAAAKVLILMNTLFKQEVTLKDIEVEGINNISIETLKDKSKILKLIGSIEKKSNGEIEGSVKLERLEKDDPLANVNGCDNALCFETEHLGKLFVIGPGAGGKETAHGILNDLFDIYNIRI